MIDALGFEAHFIDHLSPVIHALPESARGRFLVETGLANRARALGHDPEPMAGNAIRRQTLPPTVRDAEGPIALVASYGDTKVGRRLGYRRFVFLEHGIGQSYAGDRGRHAAHGSYAGGTDRDDVGLFLVPNHYSAERWRQAYPPASVAIVGSPRIDFLPSRDGGDGPDPVVAISFHWPANVSEEAGTAFGEFRTILPDLAAAFPGRVIGHGHPRAWDMLQLGKHYDRAGIESVRDFDEVCRRADVYLCDNSSSLYEFASTGRPVVVMNSRHWRRSVSHGLRFWDAAQVGVNVDAPADLVAAVHQALADPPEVQQAREDALSIVYGLRTNGAAAAATAILDWVAARQAVAA